ncbi:MAG: 2-C-methyl-D-erythritol 4-phosphate cytidylyltransferase [Mycobacteriales bacterium]
MSSVAAVVPAAGCGARLGLGRPKALHPIAGVAMVVRALAQLDACPLVTWAVVAAPLEQVAHLRRLVSDAGLGLPVEVVAGGARRADSVRAALAVLPQEPDVVVIHDAARPFAPPQLFAAVVQAVREGADAAVPVVAVTDTVKVVDQAGQIVKTLSREGLRAVQTPQAFLRQALISAHELGERAATDDAALVEAAGGRVVAVPGHPEAFKVTGPLDLLLAEALAARRQHVS